MREASKSRTTSDLCVNITPPKLEIFVDFGKSFDFKAVFGHVLM